MTSPLVLVAEEDFAGCQAIGQRSGQQDAYAFSAIPARPGSATGLLLIVADGMGGHAAGNRASELVVQTFAEAFHHCGDSMDGRFRCALQAANDALAAAIDADPDRLEGMGTTLLAAAVTPLGLEWVSVGDSPLYLFRRGALRRVNADHSFRPVLREMVARKELTEERAATSSLRNRLRAAVVGGEIALLDLSPKPLPLLDGDIVVAGSDGLQTLTDAQLGDVLKPCATENAAAMARRLVAAVEAVEAPKQDNITVGIVKPGKTWLVAPFGLVPSAPPGASASGTAEAKH